MARVETSEAVIVGGGLVGSLLSVFLVRRGYDVTVYERHPDIRTSGAEAGRSINLVVTRRGIRALEQAGLAKGALELTVPVTGRMVHAPDGGLSYQPYGKDDAECNYSISRAGLNEFLVREAAAQGVRFRFRTALTGADLESGRLVLRNEASGRDVEVFAPVVFGADGAGSVLRNGFKKLEGFEESVEMLGHGYKELLIPATDGGAFRIEKNALHVWPRGEFMLMALPNLDGSFTVTLYLPFRGEQGFDMLRKPGHVMALFQEHFPDAIPLIPDLAATFLANPTGTLGTLRCHPWNFHGKALLIGDAAHAIVPFFGQGMNTGFEDCTVLGELLDEDRSDLAGAFGEYTRRRKPDGDAIADMALDNFVEMRDRVGDPEFLLRKQVENRMERTMPLQYRSRYSMVMYSHIPFRTAFEAGRIQQGILDELCDGIERAEDLDVERAAQLVRDRLSPFLRERGVVLDY